MTNPNPFTVSSNSDGTVTLLEQRLDGQQVAALVTDLLAYMCEAAAKSGRADEAKKIGGGEQIYAVRPDVIAATPAPKGQDQRIVLACGFAHVGVIVPSAIVRALGENFVALSADEGRAH